MLRPCRLSEADVNCSRRTKDMISDLPDELLYTIISYLKLREIVQLSLLSNRWRRVCSSMPELIFDWDNMFVTDSNRELWENNENSCVIYKEKFVKGVNQVLKFYQEKQISSFVVCCCLGFECSSDIDQWVRFALSRGVQTLCLKFYCSEYCSKRSQDKNGALIEGKYVLEKELFEGSNHNLKDLSLYACVLRPNFTYQFSSLETLQLIKSPLSLYDFNSLFSCLVNLKHLTLYRCNLPTKLCLGGLPLLEHFAVMVSVGLKTIDLSNANLLTFVCPASLHDITFDLRGAPNVTELWCHGNRWAFQYVFTRVQRQLPGLRVLGIYSRSDWVKFIPETIPVFSQVTSLTLTFIRHPKFSMLKMISILSAFPCLCTFELMTRCPEDVDEEKAKPVEYVPRHLTKVELGGFCSTPNQMEFAIYLLKNASALRWLVIEQEVKPYVPKRQSWDEGEREMVYERLQEFAKDGVLVVR